jgi:hypothetical protein
MYKYDLRLWSGVGCIRMERNAATKRRVLMIVESLRLAAGQQCLGRNLLYGVSYTDSHSIRNNILLPSFPRSITYAGGTVPFPIPCARVAMVTCWSFRLILGSLGKTLTRKRSWLRHYATSRRVAGSSPDEVDFFLIYLILNPSSRTLALGSTQPLTEMSTGIFLGSKGRPACKTDKLTAIYEPIV